MKMEKARYISKVLNEVQADLWVTPMPRRESLGLTKLEWKEQRAEIKEGLLKPQEAMTTLLAVLASLYFKRDRKDITTHSALTAFTTKKELNAGLRLLDILTQHEFIEKHLRYDSKGHTFYVYTLCDKLTFKMMADELVTISSGEMLFSEEAQSGVRVVRGREKQENNIIDTAEYISDTEFMINQAVLEFLNTHVTAPEKIAKTFVEETSIAQAKSVSDKQLKFLTNAAKAKQRQSIDKYKRTTTNATNLIEKGPFRFKYYYDSRGRINTEAPYIISPQGSDVEKALITPTHKEVLTVDGELALLEALIGYSEDSRVADGEHTLEYFANIYNNIDDNLWILSEWDKPTMSYSLCKTAADFLANPTEPVSAFVPLDGRSSGSQHWSALLKSSALTNMLGMTPHESERDLYETVADAWEAKLPTAQKHMATRKHTKKTCMTIPYSAKLATTSDYLRGVFGKEDKDILNSASRDLYISAQTVMQPVTVGMDWLQASAKIIIDETASATIEWVTPDGFRASQCKYQVDKGEVVAVIDGKRRKFVYSYPKKLHGELIPNRNKHISSISPNIIHSLDATHLRMVAKELQARGIPSIYVHDSFAVPVNHRETLYDIIVNQFVILYSGDYLLELKEQWEATYSVTLPELPKYGNYDIETLYECKNFFA